MKKLKVVELEKYLTYHDIKLPKNKQQKSDKVDIIQAHVGRKIYDQMITSADLGKTISIIQIQIRMKVVMVWIV